MRRLIPLMAIVAGMVIGCQVQQAPTSPLDAAAPAAKPETPAEYAQRLRLRAHEIAEGELAKMAAADLVYRGSSELQSTILERTGEDVGHFMKIYRSFTGAHVMGIDGTSSLLTPVSIRIRYDYNLVGTAMHSMGQRRARTESQKDMEYAVIGQFFVSRAYPCDMDGLVVGAIPPLPPRAKYWAHKFQMMMDNPDMTGYGGGEVRQSTAASGAGRPGAVQPGGVGGPSFPAGNLPVMPKTPPPGAMDD